MPVPADKLTAAEIRAIASSGVLIAANIIVSHKIVVYHFSWFWL